MLLGLIVGGLRFILLGIASLVCRTIGDDAVDDGRCCNVPWALQRPVRAHHIVLAPRHVQNNSVNLQSLGTADCTFYWESLYQFHLADNFPCTHKYPCLIPGCPWG